MLTAHCSLKDVTSIVNTNPKRGNSEPAQLAWLFAISLYKYVNETVIISLEKNASAKIKCFSSIYNPVVPSLSAVQISRLKAMGHVGL